MHEGFIKHTKESGLMMFASGRKNKKEEEEEQGEHEHNLGSEEIHERTHNLKKSC